MRFNTIGVRIETQFRDDKKRALEGDGFTLESTDRLVMFLRRDFHPSAFSPRSEHARQRLWDDVIILENQTLNHSLQKQRALD